MSAVYMVNGHGKELLHVEAVTLKPDERVIMLCNWGCTLFTKNLFTDFIYTHLAKAQNTHELIAMMMDPESKGKKYKPLSFIKNIMCEYRDKVPELQFIFKDKNFRAGVHELPVIAINDAGNRASASQLKSPDVKLFHRSYYSQFHITENKISLSQLINTLRKRKDDGFLIVVFACREFHSEIKATKIKDIKWWHRM